MEQRVQREVVMHRLRIVAFVLVVGLVAVPGFGISANENDSALTQGKLLFRSRDIAAVNLKGQSGR
jgi:hypothetical protein